VETGTHQQLLEKRGFYYDLYESQFMDALGEAA
jgi:ABC-type multidrug transport system fused ATPase/permease subunit